MKETFSRLNVDVPSDVYLKYRIALTTNQMTAKEHINKLILEYLNNV